MSAYEIGSVPSFCAYRIGDLEVFTLYDGYADRPVRAGMVANAEVAEIEAALRAAGLPPTSMRSHFTALAVSDRGRLMLIDTGTGGAPVYGPESGYLLRSMGAAGLDPRRVETILLTHLHGDHLYGLMDPATLAPTFPHAEIVVPAVELHWWTQPGVDQLDLGPTRVDLARRIAATIAVWKNVRTFEPHAEVVPGVHAIPAYGHSPGHTAYLLASGNSQLLATADVSLNPALYLKHPHWQATLDQDPATAVETRRRIFDRVVADKAFVTGMHWGLDNVGAVTSDGNGYSFEPLAGRIG